MLIQAKDLPFRELNRQINAAGEQSVTLQGVMGQRFIASGLKGKDVEINGIPGNALGAYLDGAHITVRGNAQDATGDTMNEGSIRIYGRSGDATGYAMRGGSIYVQGDSGYRAGIHMKAYSAKYPVLVIGGAAGSFLGEYLAGGVIIVLGIGHEAEGKAPVGYFTGTGMYGGKIFLRSAHVPHDLPPQVDVREAAAQDREEAYAHVAQYCAYFGGDPHQLMEHRLLVLTPSEESSYKQLYCAQ
ncbi:MAG: glutamate synthase [Christensenellaceae bacterium]|jgi:glutamate synthase domain-containing protein 3|nr:glutamate synthase [Christensenellaceae bacterium]